MKNVIGPAVDPPHDPEDEPHGAGIRAISTMSFSW